jgi:hypothetical protein
VELFVSTEEYKSRLRGAPDAQGAQFAGRRGTT